MCSFVFGWARDFIKAIYVMKDENVGGAETTDKAREHFRIRLKRRPVAAMDMLR